MMSAEAPDRAKLDANTEMASQRTALSLQRTLMSADSTQMSVLRTSLSLIGFGFTIYKLLEEVGKNAGRAALAHPARNLGVGLVLLGIGLLIGGLYDRYRTMRELGQRGQALYHEGLLRTPFEPRASPNMVASVLLLLGGLLVLLGIVAEPDLSADVQYRSGAVAAYAPAPRHPRLALRGRRSLLGSRWSVGDRGWQISNSAIPPWP